MYHMLYFMKQAEQIDVPRGKWHVIEMFPTDLK